VNSFIGALPQWRIGPAQRYDLKRSISAHQNQGIG
jgi:hypothetical protein